MARKPRIEFEGAIYHVLNRGNYRADLFESAGAADAFIKCLWETCEKTGWLIHAYCLMRNHYHLAVETPHGNLVQGVHWLQSTYGNRFNRYRDERGHAFQGRYKAILVEPGMHLAQLVAYIHLNPVRAGIVQVEHLDRFRWASYRHFVRSPDKRPPALACGEWLSAMNGLTDTPQGWRAYHDYLVWLTAKPGRQKEASFHMMCQGWAHGSEEYQQELAEDFLKKPLARDWGGAELAELNRRDWERQLQEGLTILGKSLDTASRQPKSASWKIAIAAWLKCRTCVSNRWLGEQLHMGPPDAVSRYTGELLRGQRPAAEPLLGKLTTSIRG